MLVKNGLCVFARIGVSTNSGYSGYIPRKMALQSHKTRNPWGGYKVDTSGYDD